MQIITPIVFVLLTISYYELVLKPSWQQKHFSTVLDPFPGWKDFIIANVNACRNQHDCMTCRQLIQLFDLKFRRVAPKEAFIAALEHLWNIADTKLKNIVIEEAAHDSRPLINAKLIMQ